MKKFMNFRLAFILALTLICSTIFSVFVFVSTKSKLVLMIVSLGLIFVCLILLLIFKRKFLAVIFVAVFFFTIPVVSVYFKAKSLDKNCDINVENCQIYGKIYIKKENLDKKIVKIYLTDIEILSGETKNKINGNIFVYINTQNLDTSKLTVGRYVHVNADLKLYSLHDEELGKAVSKISDGVVGDAFIYSYNVKPTDRVELSLSDKIRKNVYERSTQNKYSEIGYAMLFGDTTILNPDIKGVFQESGTAHLLAVSGFHVSLVVLILSFVLNKLRANRYAKVAVVGCVLLFYGMLCNFSVSVLRAIIMSLVALYATARTKEYDGLSALSVAAILLLVIAPLQLFDISFVLSFTSVLSIILLMPVISRALSKVFYDKFASTLSLSLAVQVGLFVTQLYYFGTVPILSIFTNLITVPLASFAFMYYIIMTILCTILPFAQPVMIVFDWIMQLLVRFNYLISGISFTVGAGVVSVFALALSYIFMFVASDYIFIKQKYKSVSSLIILAIITVLVII